jgi:hypothetical protein
MNKTITLYLTPAEANGAHWALGNFAMAGNYQDTNNDKRLYASICRVHSKLVAAMARAEGRAA